MYERLLNKGKRPNGQEIEGAIGERLPLWIEIHRYIKDKYDFDKELVFFTKKYGWAIRYRRKGRTMIYFFPEVHAFSILIVLGKQESEKVTTQISHLTDKMRSVFEETEQLHDGRWLWIRIIEESDLESLKILLAAKRKPKKY